MQNHAPYTPAQPDSYRPGTKLWLCVRKAYEEVLLDLPLEYDTDWSVIGLQGQNIALASQNYEVTREALLTLLAEGRFPDWPAKAPIPDAIRMAVRRVNQERRLGRDLNLAISLSATPLVQEDLGQTY